MRLRRLLAGVASGVGLAAVTNRVLSAQAHQPRAPLGRATKTYRWRGFDVSYTEAGKPSNPDLVLLHGINAAGSSAEFAPPFDSLADHFHVVAPDLPGFGLSDRPPLMYSPSLYVTFLADFVTDVTEDSIVVGSSLTGTYAAMAIADEDLGIDARELVLVCPTANTVPGRRTWLRSLLRTPLVGEGLFNLLASKRSLRHFQADHGFYDMAHADDEWLDYRWQLTHQEGARFAPASFVSGYLDPDVDLSELVASLDVPVTVLWGGDSELLPVSRGRDLADAANVPFVVFDEALLLPHYEHPARFVDLVRGERPASEGDGDEGALEATE